MNLCYFASSKSRLSANGSSAFRPLRSSIVNFDGIFPSGSKCWVAIAPSSDGSNEVP